VKVYT